MLIDINATPALLSQAMLFETKKEAIMAIVLFSYTLPTNPEALKQYGEKVKGWIDVVLSDPNATEVRVFRSSDGKDAMTVTEVQSIAESEKFTASEKFKTLRRELEKAGCSNLQLRAWDVSPLVPKAMRRAA